MPHTDANERRHRRPTKGRLRRLLMVAMVAVLAAPTLTPAAGAQEMEAVLEKAEPATGLDRFIGEWWNGQEWSVFASGDPGLAVDPPTPPATAVEHEGASGETACAPTEGETPTHLSSTTRRSLGRAQVTKEKAPGTLTFCPPPPPPPPTPCSAHFPVGTTTTPAFVDGDVAALEPANGSFVSDDLDDLPLIGTPAAMQNGAFSGFARLARAVTGQGEAGFVNVEFHLELPDGLAVPSDLQVEVTSVDDEGNVASYSPWLSQVFCYADQSGFNTSSVYVSALGLYLLDGETPPESITFVAAMNDADGDFLAADTTTIHIGPPPVAAGGLIADGLGLAITQDGIDGAEVALLDHFRPQVEDLIIEKLEDEGVEVITSNFGIGLDLTWVAAIGANGGLRVALDAGFHFYIKRNNCYGHIDVDDLSAVLDLAVGQTGGAFTVAVDALTIDEGDIDVELTSGFCSFFVWEGFVENAIENGIEEALDNSEEFETLISDAVTTYIGGLSLGGLLGGLVNLSSTVTLTSVVVQNGGLEIQADASFAADGPFDGPPLVASPAPGPQPNMNFLTSQRTVMSTGDLFGAGAWIAPALLNQLATAAVSEGVFSRVDTQGSSQLSAFQMQGQCGGVAGEPEFDQDVFIDFAATAAPTIEENPNAGGDPATDITSANLLSINGLIVTFRVADTGCGEGGVIGELQLNVHELGFELAGNSQYQTLSFDAQVHPACPSFGADCPISAVTLRNPLGHPTFGPIINQFTGSSVVATGLPDLLAGFGSSVALPGQAIGLDVIPMAFDEISGVVDGYFKILPSPKQPNVTGFETSGNFGPFVAGTTEDFTYSFTAVSNMPGPKTFTWTFVGGGGTVTTTQTTSHFFDDFPVPNTLPSTNGPGVTVQVVDEWGRSIHGWWTDEEIFGENEV